MNCIKPPKYVVSVLMRLEDNGYSAFLVGGCVRDIIINRRPVDWDICTSALPEEVMAVFPNTRPTGLKHGTVTVIEHGSSVEVTTFRSDGEYKDHRRPENVRYIADLMGDLERRDFTVNALALPLTGIIFDPFGGRADIRSRLIRCVGDPDRRFNEDALRMLRAFRFSAVLGFEIETDTLAAIRKNAFLADSLARERVCAEVEKILLSDSPQILSAVIGYGLLGKATDMQAMAPDLTLLKTLPKNRGQRWAGLCSLLIKNGSIPDVEDFLQLLRLDSATIHNSTAGCRFAIKGVPSNKLEWKKLLSRNGNEIGKCTAAAAELMYGPGYLKLYNSVIKSGECYSLKRLSVSGDDLLELGFRGAELGNMLYCLLDHVLEFPFDNRKNILLDMAGKVKNTGKN